MDDLLNEFLTETSESLAVIDVELVKFEQDPKDGQILQNIFRLVHTIKGTCGFLGLPRLESVAHAGENILGKFRDGELEVTPEAVTLILKCIDAIRALLGELEESGSEPEGEDTDLINELNVMAEGSGAAPAPAEEAAADSVAAEDMDDGGAGADAPVLSDAGFPIAAELLAEVAEAEAAGKKAASDGEMAVEMAEDDTGEAAENSAPADAAAEEPAAAVEAPKETPKDKPKKTKAPAKSEGERAPRESSVAAQSIRVNVELLENLMTLVSEMVLTRNQLMQMVRGHEDSEFKAPLQRLSLITTDLQEGVMKTRMQPIGNAWAKLPRIVRDLSVEANKKIDLQMLGAETELDRQVLELIKDPLTHMVRNSADHGLEGLEERAAAGKPEIGKIVLNAYHEGGHIIIQIADDGRGLNTDRIREKIVEKGLASEAELESMTEQQIQMHIFKAGFSTAEKVTSVSGRGVGMDVVRTNIETIGGTIELNSVAGQGSTFTIKIPLTLAIVSALVVACGNERFAIPQISVLELVRASRHSEITVETINQSPLLRLRNRLLPLVSLRDLLKLNEPQEDDGSVIDGTAEEIAATTPESEASVPDDARDAPGTAALEAAAADMAETAEAIAAAERVMEQARAAYEELAAHAEKGAGEIGISESDLAAALEQASEAKAASEAEYEAAKAAHATAKAAHAAAEKASGRAEGVQASASPEIPASADSNDTEARSATDENFIVVTQVGTCTFGIIVDKVFDTEEIVVKPVAPILRGISFYSGNTILGDGSVIMILDPNGIAAATGTSGMSHDDAEATEAIMANRDETTSMLVFRTGGDELRAVPLALIARLEEIDMATTERSHGRYVVQYRGHLMPLIPVNPDHEWKSEGRQPILVFTDRDRSMGLVVDEIVDIVEDQLKVELSSEVEGFIGSAVIQGKSTDVIDAGYYLTTAFPDWFGAPECAVTQGDRGGQAPHVLLVDDSPFFRNLLTPLLSAAGYRVTTVESGDIALSMREHGATFDAIISDIEMPGMDGFEFAEAVRGDARWKNLPMVALSSRATERDFERGREVGFDDYVAKFDREAVVSCLGRIIGTVGGGDGAVN